MQIQGAWLSHPVYYETKNCISLFSSNVDHFIQKLKEVINVPSIEWLHTSYVTGTRGSKWLLQTLLDINRLSKEAPKVRVYSAAAEENSMFEEAGNDMATCPKDTHGLWLPDIMKPLQERTLKVL